MRSFHPMEVLPTASDIRMGGSCTCKKSKYVAHGYSNAEPTGKKIPDRVTHRCLKLYCQCFSSSTTCGPRCKCTVCNNTAVHADAIEQARKSILERNPSAFDHKFLTPPPAPVYRHHYPSPPPIPDHLYVSSAPKGRAIGCKCRRSFCLKKYCECYQNSQFCGVSCGCTNCQNVPETPPTTRMPVVQAVHSEHRWGPMRPEIRPEVRSEVRRRLPLTRPPVRPPVEREEDRMAMMAAVAMTELVKETSKTEILRRSASVEEREHVSDMEEDCYQTPNNSMDESMDSKRKVVIDNSRVPLKKRKSSMDEDFTSASSTPMDLESRNPSPIETKHSPPVEPKRAPQSHSKVLGQFHGPEIAYLTPRASPPHMYMDHRPFPHLLYRPYQPYPPRPYDDALKRTGLPKSLSFRKICSRCGKTRGEHGDLGFGNKCVFQDCGRCGAGEHIHKKMGQPMGVLCQLTEAQGAMQGASKVYDRKIRELAARADLQRELQRVREEHAERMVHVTGGHH